MRGLNAEAIPLLAEALRFHHLPPLRHKKTAIAGGFFVPLLRGRDVDRQALKEVAVKFGRVHVG